MPFPGGQPPWQVKDLTDLSNQGKLSGVNPVILGAIAQEESGFEVAGAGFNSAGYGGFYGLGLGKYAGGNQETKASLLDPSEASFIHQSITAAAAFNSYLTEAASEGYTGKQLPERAETIFQMGGGTPGIESGGGVALVDQALGNASPGGGTTTQGGTASGGTGGIGGGVNSGSNSSSTPKTPLGGLAGVLQQLNDLMNPASPGLTATVSSLGTANVGQILQTFAVRGVFAAAFLGLIYVGVKQITGGGGSSSVIEIVQEQQKSKQADQRIANAQAETERKSAPPPVKRTETVKTTHATVTHVNVPKTPNPKAPSRPPAASTAGSSAAAGGVVSTASDLAEGAIGVL